MPRPRLGDLAGAAGDVGTLVPLAAGLIVVTGIQPAGFFVAFGLATIFAGLAFRLPMPVQPQKAVAAAAIAEGWTAGEVYGAGLGMGLAWLAIAATPLLDLVRRAVPLFVARGIQLALAFTLAVQALRLLASGPALGLLAALLFLLTLRFRLAGLALTLVAAFLAVGPAALSMAFAPAAPVLALPSAADALAGMLRGGVAQMPLTLANAVVATAALTVRYFPAHPASERRLAASTGLISVGSSLLGSAPFCHGAGGLAAQYFYGARTVWKNILEGGFALALGLFFAPGLTAVLVAFPLPLLGGLLLLVAVELLASAQGLFGWQGWIATAMAVVAIITNVGVAFGAGLVLAYAIRFAVHRGWLPRLKGKTPAEYLALVPRRVLGPSRAA